MDDMKKITSVLLTLALAMSIAGTALAAPRMNFWDVSYDDWYYTDVATAFESGLINGKDANHFAPNANLTYAEAVKLAACMNQLFHEGYVNLENGSPWYQTYVDYAYDHGIIWKDYPWTQNATRAGYVEIFAHALPAYALDAMNDIPDGVIPDVSMNHPQAEEIYMLYRAGVLTGSDSAGTFNPGASIRRCEVAAIVTRMMDSAFRREVYLGGGSYGPNSEDYRWVDISDLAGIWYMDGDYSADSYIYITWDGEWTFYQRAYGREPWEADSGYIVTVEGDPNGFTAVSVNDEEWEYYFSVIPKEANEAGYDVLWWNSDIAFMLME